MRLRIVLGGDYKGEDGETRWVDLLFSEQDDNSTKWNKILKFITLSSLGN